MKKTRPNTDGTPTAFAHHRADGSVDIRSLTNVSLQFRMLRLQHAMTAADILAVANHLADHFEELGLTTPPTVQALRTARNTLRAVRSTSGARR